MHKRLTLAGTTGLALAGLVWAGAATAAEVTLNAVSAFAEGTTFSKNFERFIEKVNEQGKGVIQINYRGGGKKVMNPFQLGDAIRTGVVDMGNLPGAFYTKLMPEADAIKLSQFTIAEERKNGAWAYVNKIHNKKVNAHHLARQKDCVPFHLYINKKIDKPDLSGMKIRVTPIYRAFFASMGASMIRTKPGDVYTALERGTVDGYGWPTQGVLDLGWHEVTKFRVDPPFYRASVEVLMNLDKWNALDDKQRGVLQSAAVWMESLCEEDKQVNSTERDRQAKVGIETIAFTGADGEAYLKQSYETGWAAFIKANPDEGPKLKKLLSR
ncbi:MAG: TRAP transporter substrate-binding protein DctP [Alphaproteobacteria bacterium]|nr:TRAP transporter substrate-binding protein DctP [Alphaproteobacteria bacterium]